MKQTLTKQAIQDWCLIGLKPMHRALLRRSTENALINQGVASKEQLILWNLEEWDASIDHQSAQSQRKRIHRAGVLIVDKLSLLQHADMDRTLDPFFSVFADRSSGQIRLLWNWSLTGRQDLRWCTEMSFDGIIYNPQSLRHWLPCCLRLSPSRDGQSNSLLRDIQLPSL